MKLRTAALIPATAPAQPPAGRLALRAARLVVEEAAAGEIEALHRAGMTPMQALQAALDVAGAGPLHLSFDPPMTPQGRNEPLGGSGGSKENAFFLVEPQSGDSV